MTLSNDFRRKADLNNPPGMWTRFNPTLLAVQKAVFDGIIGDVHYLTSDFSAAAVGVRPEDHKTFSPDLAGGALLDIGPYPLVWVSTFGQPEFASRSFPDTRVGHDDPVSTP